MQEVAQAAQVAQEVANNYSTLKYIGVGLCSIGMAGAALAIGNIFGSFFNSIARNPSAAPKLEKYIYIAAGLAEAMGIFAVLLAFMVMFS
jgi:F-type H+-transporting ATPase subunit c